MKKTIAALLALSLTACASTPYTPVVDGKGSDMRNYHHDLSECQLLSQQRDPVSQMGTGAIAGAIFGALIGGAIGGSDGAKFGAKVFAVQGAATGAATGVIEQNGIVKKCMAGRGYNVLA